MLAEGHDELGQPGGAGAEVGVRDPVRDDPGELLGRGVEAGEAYLEADLVVLGSRVESYGMVVTEALAHGIPVLAPAVGGIEEALGRTPEGELPGILDLLVAAGLVKSKGDARRTVAEGGAYLNNVRVEDPELRPTEADLVAGSWLVLRRGKKNFAGIEVG